MTFHIIEVELLKVLLLPLLPGHKESFLLVTPSVNFTCDRWALVSGSLNSQEICLERLIALNLKTLPSLVNLSSRRS